MKPPYIAPVRAVSILALSIAALAACAPRAETPASAAVDPAIAAATERLMGMISCTDRVRSDDYENRFASTDCRLDLGATPEAGFGVVTFAPRTAEAELGETSVAVLKSSAEPPVVTLTESAVYDYIAAPELADVDADGLNDILIPLSTGNVNTTYGVWLQRAGLTFTRAGELGSLPLRTPEGVIFAQGRSSAASWTSEFYTLEADTLRRVAVVDVVAEDTAGEGDAMTVTSTVCSVRIREGSTLTAEALCALPEVKDMYGEATQRIIVADADPTFVWDDTSL
jgi:hypothetical protein